MSYSEVKRLLSSSEQIHGLIASPITEANRGPLKVLDIGSGTGRIANFLKEGNPESCVIAMEVDHDLSRLARKFRNGLEFVTADALHLPFIESTFQLATAINVAHEISAAPTADLRYSNFIRLCNGVAKVMSRDGDFFMFDGHMPENAGEQVLLRTKNAQAEKALDVFSTTYLAKRVDVNRIGIGRYKMSIEDLVTFLTKFNYIFTEYWETERKEFYPFITLGQMKSSLCLAGLDVVSTIHPQGRTGLDTFLEYFDLDGYNTANFPPRASSC